MTKPWHEEAAELLAKATPGEWTAYHRPLSPPKFQGITAGFPHGPVVLDAEEKWSVSMDDGQLMTRAPALLKAALEERERLIAALAAKVTTAVSRRTVRVRLARLAEKAGQG